MRKIQTIQPFIQPPCRKRVAAYARVSMEKDAMLLSLSAQISYYNKHIQEHGDWEFAGVYADEPTTGTQGSRPEFQRLLADCRAGKIDMVITKSITRFARNTVLLLEAIRELKLLSVDVFFEKENIHTLSADGELMLSLLASYAQEESRSVSENQKWRIRKMFAEGRPNTGHMLGYRLVDGKLRIVPEEAEIVRQIFADYLSGMGLNAIMKKLNRAGVPAMRGGLWRESVLYGILRNEKYSGNMLLQKTFIADHISKRKRINRGELPMYEVINSHEAIIPSDIFEKVQQMRARRAKKSVRPEEKYLFTGLIVCDRCGCHYRRKQANAGSKYKKPVWICGTFNTYGKSACPSQQIPEQILLEKTAEVMGTEAFDRALLEELLTTIRIPTANRIEYVFKDGRVITKEWQNPSRRCSWDDAMRQAARDRQLSIIEKRKKDE